MKTDGLSLDDKRSEVKENDIPDILKRFHKPEGETKRKRTDQSFLVPFNEIKSNDWDLSIKRYKEVIDITTTYSTPKSLIKEIKAIDNNRKKSIQILERLLQ